MMLKPNFSSVNFVLGLTEILTVYFSVKPREVKMTGLVESMGPERI